MKSIIIEGILLLECPVFSAINVTLFFQFYTAAKIV